MKKIIICFLFIFAIIVILFTIWYKQNVQYLNKIKNFNKEFEIYLDKEISGVDLTTIMNKAIENNSQYNLKKNIDGTYKNDGKNSIQIFVMPTQKRKILSNGSL